MYQEIPYEEKVNQIIKQMPEGIFLTVKHEGDTNTMVIGWGQIGFIWGKPMFIAYIRPSRYTYELLEKSKEFTVSIPLHVDMKKELAICGGKSGKDMDKIEACGFTMIPGRKINTPIIGECERHYECKVVYQQKLDHEALSSIITSRYYGDGIYHMVYYGEIVDSYLYTKGV